MPDEYEEIQRLRELWSRAIMTMNQIFLPLILVIFSIFVAQLPKFIEMEWGFYYLLAIFLIVKQAYPRSMGQILMKFGVSREEIVSGQEIDIEAVLVGKKVSLQTMEETNERGTFARIVAGSLKPDTEGDAPETEASASASCSLIDRVFAKEGVV